VDNFAEYAQIYCEIAKGYSIDFFNNNKIYFKHPSLLEHFSIYNNYDVFIESAKKRGLLTEQDKIAEAIKNNWWDSDKESQYQILQKTVENLFKTRDKLLYISQKKELEPNIYELVITSIIILSIFVCIAMFHPLLQSTN
jgi:hypothetical protein